MRGIVFFLAVAFLAVLGLQRAQAQESVTIAWANKLACFDGEVRGGVVVANVGISSADIELSFQLLALVNLGFQPVEGAVESSSVSLKAGESKTVEFHFDALGINQHARSLKIMLGGRWPDKLSDSFAPCRTESIEATPTTIGDPPIPLALPKTGGWPGQKTSVSLLPFVSLLGGSASDLNTIEWVVIVDLALGAAAVLLIAIKRVIYHD